MREEKIIWRGAGWYSPLTRCPAGRDSYTEWHFVSALGSSPTREEYDEMDKHKPYGTLEYFDSSDVATK